MCLYTINKVRTQLTSRSCISCIACHTCLQNIFNSQYGWMSRNTIYKTALNDIVLNNVCDGMYFVRNVCLISPVVLKCILSCVCVCVNMDLMCKRCFSIYNKCMILFYCLLRWRAIDKWGVSEWNDFVIQTWCVNNFE